MSVWLQNLPGGWSSAPEAGTPAEARRSGCLCSEVLLVPSLPVPLPVQALHILWHLPPHTHTHTLSSASWTLSVNCLPGLRLSARLTCSQLPKEAGSDLSQLLRPTDLSPGVSGNAPDLL